MNGRRNCASLKQLTALSMHVKQTLRNFHVEQKPLTNTHRFRIPSNGWKKPIKPPLSGFLGVHSKTLPDHMKYLSAAILSTEVFDDFKPTSNRPPQPLWRNRAEASSRHPSHARSPPSRPPNSQRSHRTPGGLMMWQERERRAPPRGKDRGGRPPPAQAAARLQPPHGERKRAAARAATSGLKDTAAGGPRAATAMATTPRAAALPFVPLTCAAAPEQQGGGKDKQGEQQQTRHAPHGGGRPAAPRLALRAL